MPDETTDREVACTITPERLRERSERIGSDLASKYSGLREHEDGVTLAFEGTDESLSLVSTFVANELECCSFADYTITVTPPYDETRLTIEGPEGTKDLFRMGLADALESTGTD